MLETRGPGTKQVQHSRQAGAAGSSPRATRGRSPPGPNVSRYLDRVFELAEIEGGHSHRFRDTFPVELLLAGVPLETVSILLGHSPVKIHRKALQAMGEDASQEARRGSPEGPGMRPRRTRGALPRLIRLE